MDTQVGVPGKKSAGSTTDPAPTLPRPGGVAAKDDSRARQQGPDRRHSGIDRRSGLERRQMTRQDSGYTGPERRVNKDRRDTTGLERRRGPGRRRSDERRVAEEGEMNAQQFEFVMAVEAYKKVNKRLYPTWTEILEIINQLGYRKVLNRTVTMNAPEPALYSGVDEARLESAEPESLDDLDDSDE